MKLSNKIIKFYEWQGYFTIKMDEDKLSALEFYSIDFLQ